MDVAIVGGGVVGSLSAYLLQQLGFQVTVLEAFTTKPDDTRTVALSLSSQQMLSAIGLWEDLAPMAQPIYQVHVSDQGRFGFSRISAQAQKVPALGYVISLFQLQQTIQSRILDTVAWQSPAVVTNAVLQTDSVLLNYQQNGEHQSIAASLVLAADGANSTVAQQLGITTQSYDYEQVGVVADIQLKEEHQGIAYERFTPTGPLALLPISPNKMSLVWSLSPEQAEAIMAKSDDQFLAALQAAFGYRVGRLTHVSQRFAFPLKLTVPDQLVSGRALLFGNAAHGLHPIAGQGLNLSMRDIAGLAELLKDQTDPGASSVLEQYIVTRQKDHQQTIQLTDQLVKGFSMTLAPIALLRDIGLVLTDRIPVLNRFIARRMMGVTASNSRLTRGLPL